jgi:hypothetical protein
MELFVLFLNGMGSGKISKLLHLSTSVTQLQKGPPEKRNYNQALQKGKKDLRTNLET